MGGEVTPQMLSDTSQLKLLILLSKIILRDFSTNPKIRMDMLCGFWEILHLVVLLELVVYSLDYARTRLANDAKSAKKGGGDRQFNGLIDVYRKTMASDGVAGLYRGFVVSCAGIIVYRGCYFGFFDTLKPLVLTGSMADNFFLNFCLGYAVTVAAGLASYPLDTIRRRMMMTSGEAVKYRSSIHCAQVILAQ